MEDQKKEKSGLKINPDFWPVRQVEFSMEDEFHHPPSRTRYWIYKDGRLCGDLSWILEVRKVLYGPGLLDQSKPNFLRGESVLIQNLVALSTKVPCLSFLVTEDLGRSLFELLQNLGCCRYIRNGKIFPGEMFTEKYIPDLALEFLESGESNRDFYPQPLDWNPERWGEGEKTLSYSPLVLSDVFQDVTIDWFWKGDRVTLANLSNEIQKHLLDAMGLGDPAPWFEKNESNPDSLVVQACTALTLCVPSLNFLVREKKYLLIPGEGKREQINTWVIDRGTKYSDSNISEIWPLLCQEDLSYLGISDLEALEELAGLWSDVDLNKPDHFFSFLCYPLLAHMSVDEKPLGPFGREIALQFVKQCAHSDPKTFRESLQKSYYPGVSVTLVDLSHEDNPLPKEDCFLLGIPAYLSGTESKKALIYQWKYADTEDRVISAYSLDPFIGPVQIQVFYEKKPVSLSVFSIVARRAHTLFYSSLPSSVALRRLSESFPRLTFLARDHEQNEPILVTNSVFSKL